MPYFRFSGWGVRRLAAVFGGQGESEKGKAESQQQEAGAQSVPSSRGWWGDESGRVEAGVRRRPAHNGSHAQVLFWWKVGAFGSSTSLCCQPMLVLPRSPPSEEWDPEAGSSPSSPGAVVLALVPVFGELVAFPTVFHSFPPSCLVEGSGREKTRGKV